MAGLKGTNIKRIGHNDLEYLEKVLKEVKGQYQTKLVIIDGVYSQDGGFVFTSGNYYSLQDL